MTDQNLQIRVGPLVQIVLPTGERTAPFSDIALEGDDAATISDGDLKDRVARWFDIDADQLSSLVVERRTTGNILISPKPTFGDFSLMVS